jgi:hypothetical protein
VTAAGAEKLIPTNDGATRRADPAAGHGPFWQWQLGTAAHAEPIAGAIGMATVRAGQPIFLARQADAPYSTLDLAITPGRAERRRRFDGRPPARQQGIDQGRRHGRRKHKE